MNDESTETEAPAPSKGKFIERRKTEKRRNWPLLILSYVAIVVSLIALVGVLTNRERGNDLREGLKDNCEDTFKPSHEFYQSQLTESLAHGVRYYHELFPDYPVDQLREDIKNNRENLQAAVDAYDPANCDDLDE